MIRLVVATDLSQRSVQAVQRAVRLIRHQGGGDWTLLHVVDDDAPREFVAEHVQRVQALLEEQAQQLAEQAGSRPRVVVGSGEVEAIVVEASVGLGADLLVLGMHRRSALRDLFVGSTAERLLRSSRLPVLRVATPAEHDYRQALAALDSSPVALQALGTAQRLGLLDLSRCEVVHALAAMPKGILVDTAVERSLLECRISEARQALLDSLQAGGLALPAGRVRVQQGDPRQVIGEALAQSQAELLVIGSHARSGMPRLVLGSVASALLADLACDILCVPPHA